MQHAEQPQPVRRPGKREARNVAVKSERAEHLELLGETGVAKKTAWEGHLPKVILSTEVQREQEDLEKEKHLSSLMQRLHPETQGDWVPTPSTTDLHASNEREWADRRINTFMRRLQERKMTEDEMDGFGEEFVKLKNAIEQQQTKHPTEANFKAIERLENAIHASKLTRRDALHELAFGVGVQEIEREAEMAGKKAENAAEEYAETIQEKYGTTPEALVSGHAPFVARIKFGFNRLGNSIRRAAARLSGMNPEGMRRLRTDFDRWQEAQREIQSGELARNERLPQVRKHRASPEERRNKTAYDEELVKARATQEEQQLAKDRAEAKEILGKRSVELFNEIKDRMAFLHGGNAERFSFTAEDYVLNAAKYVDALERRQKGGIKEYSAVLREMNKDLGWPTDLDPRIPRVVQSVEEANPADVELIEEPKTEAPLKPARRSSRRRIPENPTFEPMTVAKAQEILPDAHGFWEFVKAAYTKAPTDVQERLAQIGTHDGITNYVLLTAQVLDAKKNNLRTPATAEALTMLNLFAKDLGIPENKTLIPPSYATLGKKPSDKLGVMRGPMQRKQAVAKSNVRWKM